VAESDDGGAAEQPFREALARMRERQRSEREAHIDRLVADAGKQGRCVDRAYWSLVYDLELAPLTSNRRQLAELGIEVPPDESVAEAEVGAVLWRVIRGLAVLNTFLLHTDHLTDRELYRRLDSTILDEPVREICDGSGGREFIDLVGGVAPDPEPRPPVSERDRQLPRPEQP